jgi:DNA-binding transcriptional regulator LsrR (DeoR family)
MKRGPDSTTIYRIARRYYKDGLSQEEIAKREGFSRSQVSRLVDKAREMGMVRIELVPPSQPRSDEIAAIEAGLCLKRVIVAPLRSPRRDDGMAIASAIAATAADSLPDAIGGFHVVGVGWGRTVYAASERLADQDGSDERRFVPLIGISGDDDPNLQINTIIDRFSAKFRSRGLFVNAPAVREEGGTPTRIERERMAALRELWDAVEVAIIGLGDPPAQSSGFIAELPALTRDALCESGAVGDILGQFFLADGSVVDTPDGYERLSFDLERLGSLERVLCLAGGAGKVAGIAAAARAGYITDLYTDEATATALYSLVSGARGTAEGRTKR